MFASRTQLEILGYSKWLKFFIYNWMD